VLLFEQALKLFSLDQLPLAASSFDLMRPVPLYLRISMLVLLGGCTVGKQRAEQRSCVGLACPDAGASSGMTRDIEIPGDGVASGTDAALVLNELCGVGACLPDDRATCELPRIETSEVDESEDSDLISLPPDSGGGAGVEQSGGGAADAGYGSDGGFDDGGSPVATDGGLQPTSDPDASVVPPLVEPDAGDPVGACQIRRVEASGDIVRACGVSGLGELGSPCASVSDCRPGFGCVGPEQQGRCLPYCCASEAACGAASYCDPRPLREPGLSEASAPRVPVCVPADNCDLGEPYPCEGDGCTCSEATSCTVVRTDGTTSCREPGEGQVDDPCPCAPGFVCSKAMGTCLKVCSARDGEAACPFGMCQLSQAFPEGWGVCVGRVEGR
jgi:hypothetical protein